MVVFQSDFQKTVLEVDKPFGEIILAQLWQNSIKYPRKKAIVSVENQDQYVTYSELYLQSLSIASFIQDQNFGSNFVTGLVMPNSLYYAPIFIGCALQGGTITAASMSNTHYELERQFVDANVKVVFCSKAAFDQVLQVAQKLSIQTIIIIDAEDQDENHNLSNIQTFNLSEILKSPPKPTLSFTKKINIHTDAVILPYSSGTTGAPKGVAITHRGFGTHANIFNALMEIFVAKTFVDKPYVFEEEYELLQLPLNHMFGVCVLFHCLLMAKPVALLKQFEPEVFFKAIETFKIRMTMIHPPVLIMLSKHSSVDKYDLSSLEIVFSSAAAAGKDIIDEVKRKHPNLRQVVQCYGTTESLVAFFPDNEKAPNGSVGKVVPLGEAKILDLDSGKELGYNQQGQILFRSPTITPGYLNRPEATKESIDDEGWYHTGDLGYIDPQGNVFIIERLKEILKVEGLPVSPAELEDVLLSHTSIADAAVIGISNAAAGEVPKAYIVRKDENLKEREIFDYVKERVAYYKQLTGGIEFVSEIPKNPSGKILRRVLRERNQTKTTAEPILTVYHLNSNSK